LFPFIFSRSQYKLFMNTAVATIDLRMQALASATDYFSGSVRKIDAGSGAAPGR
jgi:hypothetical protein